MFNVYISDNLQLLQKRACNLLFCKQGALHGDAGVQIYSMLSIGWDDLAELTIFRYWGDDLAK